jgi:hypothetical protein
VRRFKSEITGKLRVVRQSGSDVCGQCLIQFSKGTRCLPRTKRIEIPSLAKETINMNHTSKDEQGLLLKGSSSDIHP